MADENNNPFAQGPNAPDVQNQQGVEGAQQQQPAPDNAQNGIDKRFAELTAKMYAAQEASARYQEQMLAMQNNMTALLTKQNAPAPDPGLAPPEGMDPAQAAYFEKLIQRIEHTHEQRFLQVQAQQQRGEAASAVSQLAQRFNVPAQTAQSIAQRAADLAEGWRQKNLPFAPSDAADFAFMEHLKNGHVQPAAQRQPAYAVTPGYAPVQNFNPTPQNKPLPSNFDSLSPEQQIAELQKRGVEDLPL